MFISRLKDKFLEYDKYGEHRTNGIKVLFVLEIMMVFYFFSSITNPYFYYFFVPLICFGAEIAGTTLKDKYVFLFVALIGSTITIFFFDVFSVYKTFFVCFIFFYSMTFYYIIMEKFPGMVLVVPTTLGLGCYSLIYRSYPNSNFYIALNHSLLTLAATAVVFLALFLFPQKYYFFIWRRAFFEVIDGLEAFSYKIIHEKIDAIPISNGMIIMSRYSKMLPRRMPTHTVLRLTLLTFDLVMTMSYLLSFQKQLKMGYVVALHQHLATLNEACKKNQPVLLLPNELQKFDETHELRVLYKLILSWNYLCAHQ